MPLHSTLEGFMGELKTHPKGSASRGKFLTAHMSHGPFLQTLQQHPQGKQLHSQIMGFLNSPANAGPANGAQVTMKGELEKALPKTHAENASNMMGFMSGHQGAPVAQDHYMEGTGAVPQTHTETLVPRGKGYIDKDVLLPGANPAAQISQKQWPLNDERVYQAHAQNFHASRNPATPTKLPIQAPTFDTYSANPSNPTPGSANAQHEKDYWQDTEAQSQGRSLASLRSRAAKGIKERPTKATAILADDPTRKAEKPAAILKTEGDSTVADDKTYTVEQAAEILRKDFAERLAKHSRELEALVKREDLTKAAIPSHKHNQGAAASSGTEDIAAGQANPKGMNKGEESAGGSLKWREMVRHGSSSRKVKADGSRATVIHHSAYATHTPENAKKRYANHPNVGEYVIGAHKPHSVNFHHTQTDGPKHLGNHSSLEEAKAAAEKHHSSMAPGAKEETVKAEACAKCGNMHKELEKCGEITKASQDPAKGSPGPSDSAPSDNKCERCGKHSMSGLCDKCHDQLSETKKSDLVDSKGKKSDNHTDPKSADMPDESPKEPEKRADSSGGKVTKSGGPAGLGKRAMSMTKAQIKDSSGKTHSFDDAKIKKIPAAQGGEKEGGWAMNDRSPTQSSTRGSGGQAPKRDANHRSPFAKAGMGAPPTAKPPSGGNMATAPAPTSKPAAPPKMGMGKSAESLDKAGLGMAAAGQREAAQMGFGSKPAAAAPVKLPGAPAQAARANDMHSQMADVAAANKPAAPKPAAPAGNALGLKSPKAAGVTRSAGPVQNAAIPAKPGIFGKLFGKK